MKIHLLHEWLARGIRCAMVTVTAPDGGRWGVAVNARGESRGAPPARAARRAAPPRTERRA